MIATRPHVPGRGFVVVRIAAALAVITLAVAGYGAAAPTAAADSYVPVSGAGSTWSENALDQWIRDVQQYGMRVNFAGTGSSDGRHQFLNGTVDFAASDIPFQSHPEDGSAPENPATGSYAYMPITAGGTVFMYNLTIGGARVTNLRLSGDNISKIFTGVIKNWNDPAIAVDNPGLRLPNTPVVPVVRSDGSASSYQFSNWIIKQHGSLWTSYCAKSGRAPACGPTSNYPTVSGMIAQAGDLGVSGYVAQNYANGAIGYVNYSYALNAHFPVVKMLNAAGYYTEPTPQNVAVSLLKAEVDTTDTDPSLYLTQKLDNVWTDPDPRTYPLSSYGYLILPTKVQGQFTAAKGKTLAAFSYFTMCQGQQESASLGYSPMPINLVQASFTQIAKIPGAVVQNINIANCQNPTFSSTGVNLLAQTAPQPATRDKSGPVQCTTGTGGAAKTSTAVSSSPAAATAGGAKSTKTGGVASAGSKTSGGGTATGAGGSSGGTGASGSAAGAAVGGTGADGSTPASTDPAAGCDPSQQSCDDAAAVSNAQTLSATPVILAESGRGSTVAQVLLVVVALLGLIIVPGVVVRRVGEDQT